MEAIRRGTKGILKILLNCPRVDPNLLDQDGNSPAMYAIKEEKRDMARLLIGCPRVDLSTRDRNGASLQRIARWEETEVKLFEF